MLFPFSVPSLVTSLAIFQIKFCETCWKIWSLLIIGRLLHDIGSYTWFDWLHLFRSSSSFMSCHIFWRRPSPLNYLLMFQNSSSLEPSTNIIPSIAHDGCAKAKTSFPEKFSCFNQINILFSRMVQLCTASWRIFCSQWPQKPVRIRVHYVVSVRSHWWLVLESHEWLKCKWSSILV